MRKTDSRLSIMTQYCRLQQRLLETVEHNSNITENHVELICKIMGFGANSKTLIKMLNENGVFIKTSKGIFTFKN